MKKDLLNEKNNDENLNKLPELYIKRAKIGGNILCILAIIILIILLPVAISSFFEKDYKTSIILVIFALIFVIPLFLLVYLLKKKPEKIIHPEGRIDFKEYKMIRSITIQELNRIFDKQEPSMIFEVPTLYKKKYGGEVPLEQVIVYDCEDYLHFITIGMSGICEDRMESKLEYTFKLKKNTTEKFNLLIEHVNAMLQALSSFSSMKEELIKQYQSIPGEQGKGMDINGISKITGFITIPDMTIKSINTPNGEIIFIEFVGVTDIELKSIEDNQITVKELFDKIGTDITDFDRNNVI